MTQPQHKVTEFEVTDRLHAMQYQIDIGQFVKVICRIDQPLVIQSHKLILTSAEPQL